jgi:hypothetical protein
LPGSASGFFHFQKIFLSIWQKNLKNPLIFVEISNIIAPSKQSRWKFASRSGEAGEGQNGVQKTPQSEYRQGFMTHLSIAKFDKM